MENIEQFEGISINLPDNRYVLLSKYKKKPKELDWNTNPISKDQANQSLKDKNNVGFLLGHGYLCIDCDSLELQLAVEQLIKTPTYTQMSARRGLNQYIFKVNFSQESMEINLNGKQIGDILADTTTSKGKMVVLAPSRYQITEEDIKKCPELNLKPGEIKDYTILNDIEPSELTKEQLFKLILEFESDLFKNVKPSKDIFRSSDIDNLNITDIISTAGMQKDSRGQYFGSNPWHSSFGGHNFYINPSKNLAYCFRNGCDCAISPAKAIALNEGIINNCSDDLRGEDFIKTIEIAKRKYGLKQESQPLNDKNDSSPDKDSLDFWTIEDYLNYKVSKDYVIQGFMYPKEIAMNYGQTGSLKSINMLYKAVCIASGKKYLGKYKTKANPVAILSAENSIETDRERIIAIKRALGIRKKIPLYILRRSECGDVLSLGFKVMLIDFLEQKNIKVLFIDTINPVTPDLEDISTKEVTRLFNEFLKPLSDKGINIEFLHHTDKKGKKFLGSMKFVANCDCVTRIQRDELKNVFKIYNEKNRKGETNTLSIEIDFQSDKNILKKINFRLIDDTEKPIIYVASGRKKEVSENLKKEILKFYNKGMKRKDVLEKLKSKKIGYKIATFQRVWGEIR